MTPQELIDTAQRLNPEKYKLDPLETIRDAYAFIEASKMVMWKTETPKGDPSVFAEKRAVRYKRKQKKNSDLVTRLKAVTLAQRLSTAKVGEALGVSGSTISAWFRGKWAPQAKYVAAIEKFLEGTDE